MSTKDMGNPAARAALLDLHRPALEALLRDAQREGLGSDIAGYVATLRGPTGYLLASALQRRSLQRRHGPPDPDAVLRRALIEASPDLPVLLGVSPRRALADLLEDLSPRLAQLGAELHQRRPHGAGGGSIQVLVAAGGGAEIVPLDARLLAPA